MLGGLFSKTFLLIFATFIKAIFLFRVSCGQPCNGLYHKTDET